MLITSSWILDTLIFITTAVFFLYKYTSRKFDYWKTRGVTYLPPQPIFGNAFELCTFKKNIGAWFKDVYRQVDEPYFGVFIFDKPYLVLKSPDIIKRILIKDFNHFWDRTILAPRHNELFANVMFVQKNPEWKKVRARMTPVFTPAKLKGMMPHINEIGLKLSEYIRKNCDDQLEAKEICAKFTTNVIAKCAFAIDAKCFEEEQAIFRKIGRTFFDFRWITAIRQTAYFLRPEWADFLHMEFTDAWVFRYIADIFWQTIKLREETNAKENDLIDIIVSLRKNKDLCKELNFKNDRVVSQALMFFVAGFETTSSAIAFSLYELCINPDIQERLRAEIMESIRENDGVNYDSLQEMHYLDMCVSETLRKYPALPFLDRKCAEDYKIPGTDVVIEKGISVYIPMLGLHYDEKYYPEPDKYDPERFRDQKEYKENNFSYMPFGVGPRACIGERFGTLSTKLGLVHILSQFKVEKSADTPISMEFEAKSLTLASKGGLPMKFKYIPNNENGLLASK